MRAETGHYSCPANRPRVVIHANGQDLPAYHLKTVEHRNDAERGIELENKRMRQDSTRRTVAIYTAR